MNFVALLAAFSSASSNVLAGSASRRAGSARVLLVSSSTALVAATLAACVVGGAVSTTALMFGALAGLVGGGVLPLAYTAFRIGPVGPVGAAVASSSVIVVTGTGLIAGAVGSPVRAAALLLCLVAIALVTVRPTSAPPTSGKGIVLGVLTGIGFGGFTLVLSQIDQSGSLWSLIPLRLSVIAVAIVFWFAMRHRADSVPQQGHPTQLRWWMIAVSAGLFDIGSNILLLIAVGLTDLLLVAVANSTSPIFAAVLGAILLKERMTGLQVLGLIVGVVGTAVATI